MSQKKVYIGFVVGSDIVNDEKKVWKVRVNDGSELDRKKFEVATTHILLTKGLEVKFNIGSILVGEKQIPKAIEVIVKS